VRGLQVIVPVTGTAASIPPACPSRVRSPWPAPIPPEVWRPGRGRPGAG